MNRKRKPTLVEILIVVAILFILMSIVGSKSRRAQQGPRPGGGPAPTSQTARPGADDHFFMRH